MINVLFVCAGNICRSPMADAVFQDRVRKAGLSDKIKVDSAGTGNWHVGETAHPRTLSLLKRYEIPYDGCARQLHRDDLKHFDYVLAMDDENLDGIQRLERPDDTAEVSLFLHYANLAGTTNERYVPDPYYNGKYDIVYELVDKGCDALLDFICKEHNL